MKILKSALIVFLILLSVTSSLYANTTNEIFEAVEAGDIVTVKEKLDKDPLLIYTRNSDNDTLLHYAVIGGSKEMVKFVLDRGKSININDTGEWGLTPLYLSVDYGFYDIAELLINKGADINFKDKYGDYCINKAAFRGSYDIVRLFISKGADIYVKDQDGGTLLLYGARSGSMDLVTYLINKGLDVNVKDKYGNTVLHYAASSGSVELIKFLIDKGLDVNTKNAKGISILHCAASSGSLELVKFLLDKGADINVKTTGGTTILHDAARSGSIELIKFLLDKGLDVNARDEFYSTALEEAVLSHSVELVDFLLEKVNPVERSRVVDYAVHWDVPEMITLMLSKDYIDKNKFIEDCLYRASREKQKGIIVFLLSMGVNIHGTSVLITAINVGEDDEPSEDFIEFLIANGADVNDGSSLLYAAEHDYSCIVKILLDNGADPTIYDNPLYYTKDDTIKKYITNAIEMRERKVSFSRLRHKPAKMNLPIHYNQR
jgi:ankyrin repeat protein